MALVVIDGNQRVFRSFGETRPGNNVHPQLDSVIRIASLTKLMTSEMLVKLLDQGTVKLNDPLSKYAPPGARVPTYQGTPITLVNLATIPARCRANSPAARQIVRSSSGQRASSAGATSLLPR
jgi:D-alanyl-D-alanine-carboxypeptidase/D-alanyl-D-alanine-endopeptidase